jgi:hypothetical protein
MNPLLSQDKSPTPRDLEIDRVVSRTNWSWSGELVDGVTKTREHEGVILAALRGKSGTDLASTNFTLLANVRGGETFVCVLPCFVGERQSFSLTFAVGDTPSGKRYILGLPYPWPGRNEADYFFRMQTAIKAPIYRRAFVTAELTQDEDGLKGDLRIERYGDPAYQTNVGAAFEHTLRHARFNPQSLDEARLPARPK